MNATRDRTRRQTLTLDPQLLLAAIESGRWFRLTADLPADAEVQSVHGDWEGLCIRVTVWSASFPPTPIGAIPPTLGPLMVETCTGDPPRNDYHAEFNPGTGGLRIHGSATASAAELQRLAGPNVVIAGAEEARCSILAGSRL